MNAESGSGQKKPNPSPTKAIHISPETRKKLEALPKGHAMMFTPISPARRQEITEELLKAGWKVRNPGGATIVIPMKRPKN